jgi:hypothetical protein
VPLPMHLAQVRSLATILSELDAKYLSVRIWDLAAGNQDTKYEYRVLAGKMCELIIIS